MDSIVKVKKCVQHVSVIHHNSKTRIPEFSDDSDDDYIPMHIENSKSDSGSEKSEIEEEILSSETEISIIESEPEISRK